MEKIVLILFLFLSGCNEPAKLSNSSLKDSVKSEDQVVSRVTPKDDFADEDAENSELPPSQEVAEIENEKIEDEEILDRSNFPAMTIFGKVIDVWHVSKSISKEEVPVQVLLHIKKGKKSDPNTKNLEDFKTLQVNEDGTFRIENLPNETYTLFWDVPEHHYHESDYSYEVKATDAGGETEVTRTGIWVHQHGISYSFGNDGNRIEEGIVNLYRSTSPRSTQKVGPALLTVEINDGYAYLDSAHLPEIAGKGGVLEIVVDDEVVCKHGLSKANHESLTGGGSCR